MLFYQLALVEALTLAFNGSNVIEIEQGKPFNIELCCQTVDGEITNGEHFNLMSNWHQKQPSVMLSSLQHGLIIILDNGRLLQITAGIKVSNRHSTEGKQNELDSIYTPLYVMFISIFITIHHGQTNIQVYNIVL